MQVNPVIFRRYDIRGEYPNEVNEEVMRNFGKAFGSLLVERKISRAFVGRDNRKGSATMLETYLDGLISTGVDAVEIGEVPLPILFRAMDENKGTGGALITASHNPPKYNGVKNFKFNKALTQSELEEHKQVFLGEKFHEASKPGSVSKADFAESYIKAVSSRVKLGRKLRLVIDCGNSVCGHVAPKLFRALGCEVKEMYCEPMEGFPNHIPDPHREEYYDELKERVLSEKADIGIAFDGDGDRCGIVDEKGNFINSNAFIILLLRDVLPGKKNPKVICDIRLSMAVWEEIQRLGGVPIASKAGRSLMHEAGVKNDAECGFEVTGHFFLKENGGNDDAFYAAAKLCGILSNQNKPLSKLVESLPKYYTIPEIRVPCSFEKKPIVIDAVKADFRKAGYKLSELDGAKIDFEDSWALVRSASEPELTVIAEGKTREALERIYELMLKELKKQGVKIPPLKEVKVI
jgi:phosphomannomutase/phosphoglucomutase